LVPRMEPRFANTLLCEHVVPGNGGRHTLVNVFAGDIFLADFPATLFFGFYTEFFADSTIGLITLQFTLDGSVFANLTAAPAGEIIEGRPGVLVFPIFSVNIVKDADLRVDAIISGHRNQTVLTKRIKLGAPISRNDLPPPS